MRITSIIVSILVLASLTSIGNTGKISPELLKGSGRKSPVVVVKKSPTNPVGLAFNRKELTPAEVRKVAEDPEVVSIMPNTPIEVPPVPAPHLSWDDLFQRESLGHPAHGQVPIAPEMWLAKDVHGAALAWAKGFTGAGVNVAIIDQRIDFGHPDLEGTQARVTDPSSPYYGWPIVFDPASMASYAATGRPGGGYVDTSATVTGDTAVFRNRTYTLTGTSKSGVYHIGLHPDYWLRFSVGRWGIAPAVLVVDENEPGVYDTVYVDINKDFDFRNDKPCRKGDEASWADLNGNGFADYSAGMIYFIADGVNPVPASDWLYGLGPPPNGSLVAFTGAYAKYEAHGTLVASAVTAQGRVGSTYSTPQKPPDSGGMVYGTAPGAGIIQVGDIFSSQADLYDALMFCVLGYDGIPGTGDEANIVNMSFSASAVDTGGWDFLSRFITYLNETIAPRTTFVAASGNGGPGYGTVASPAGATSAVTVGAATLYGSTSALDPIRSADQIIFGDIQQWSNRGPSSLGQVKPDVVSVGAWATGNVPLSGSGENAWAVWAGTSLAAPVTSGILALIYEAYQSRHGVFPDYEEARAILMSGARDIRYNVFEQGAGFTDALRSTEIAAGTGGHIVRPSSWAAGGQRGVESPAFPNVLRPGQSEVRHFTIENTGTKPLRLSVGGTRLMRTDVKTFHVETRNSVEDMDAEMYKPDYLVDLTRLMPRDVDLLRIRVSYPYDKFSLIPADSRNLRLSSLWMVSLYDWTDLNGDGKLWVDLNGNGAVNEGEFQVGEVNRFMYGMPYANVVEVSAWQPMQRINDGLFLGLHHVLKNANIPSTRLKVELEFYRQTNWDWISAASRPLVVQPGQTARVPVKLQVPNNAVPGMYAGAITVQDDNGDRVTVPVSAVVTVRGSFGTPGSLMIDGSDGLRDTYDNGRMFGSFDWGWREESGDWRFYYVDVPQRRPNMSSFLIANANWPDMPADTDILLYRPDHNDYFSTIMPEVFGPYGITQSGGSRRTHMYAGMWPFETATGGPSEWVAGEAVPGLNLIQLHNVMTSGTAGSQPFDLSAGMIWLEPGEIRLTPGQSSIDLRCVSSMELPGISGLAYGFSFPEWITDQRVTQDVVQEPWLAKWKKDFTISGAGLIEIHLDSPNPSIDIDLYLLYDADGDGDFNWDRELIALSGNIGPKEHIRYLLPEDGKYRIAVHAYRVPSPSTFDMSILIVDGQDMNLSPPGRQIRPNRPENIRLSFPPAPSGGVGMLFLGPPDAPGVLPVPISVEG